MSSQQNTAIIKTVTVGMVDHYKDIMVSCTFNMNGSRTTRTGSRDEGKQMMKDCGLYNDVTGLLGEPCEIYIDDKNTCYFRGMWKR